MTLKEIRPGQVIQENPSYLKLAQNIERYKNSQQFRNKADHTRDAYSTDLNQYSQYCLDNNLGLDEGSIEGWIDSIKAAKATGSTISRKTSTLSSFVRWAIDEGLLETNSIRLISEHETLISILKPLSEKQVNELLTNARNPRDRILILISVTTGGSLSEIVALNTDDVYQKEDEVFLIKLKGKNKIKPRILRLDPEVGNEIIEYINTENLKPNDPLFQPMRGRKGERLSRIGAWMAIKSYSAGLGIEKLNSDILRDTFIYNFTGTNEELNQILGRVASPSPFHKAPY